MLETSMASSVLGVTPHARYGSLQRSVAAHQGQRCALHCHPCAGTPDIAEVRDNRDRVRADARERERHICGGRDHSARATGRSAR